MCGIVYAHNLDGTPVNNDVLDLFDNQRNRGLEGFGLFDGQEKHIVREVKEDNILKWLVKYDSNMLLFHHRLPTSTANVRKAAHPFATKKFFGHNQYILVHNGTITNYKELKPVHEKMGIHYQSVTKDGRFNDSESLLWDFALTMEGRQEKLAVKGGIAFICVKLVKGKLDKLFFGRNTNPLNMEITDDGLRLASQGKGEAIKDNHLYEFSYKDNILKKKEFEIPQAFYTYTGQNYNWNHHNQQLNAGHNYHPSSVGAPIAPPVLTGETHRIPGAWLPPLIQHRYQRFLDRLRPIGDDHVLDYDRDGEPIYSSDEYNSYDEYYEERQNQLVIGSGLSDEKQEEAETVVPDELEVYQVVCQYLKLAEGNFEDAYYMAETDYQELFNVPEEEQDRSYLEQVRTLEMAMAEINSDPEYTDAHSISSAWCSLTQETLSV